MTEILADTTVVIDATCKDKKRRDLILAKLQTYDKSYTTNYVRMEIKRGYLQNMVYLHQKAVLCRDISQVMKAVQGLALSLQRNKLLSCLEAITLFFEKVGQMAAPAEMTLGEYQKVMLESYLDNLIRRLWRKIDMLVDDIINPTGCFEDIQPPRKNGNLYSNSPRTCEKSLKTCKVRQFFNSHLLEVRTILAELKRSGTDDAETKNRIKALHQIERIPKRAVRPADCWYCGDALIALEAPRHADIYHNNPRHYEPICKALGKKSITGY